MILIATNSLSTLMYRLIIFHVNLPINRDTKINENYQFSPIRLSPYFTLQFVISSSSTEKEGGALAILRIVMGGNPMEEVRTRSVPVVGG
jgi:hypothetical protein